MSTDYALNAKARDNVGKGASRRLRRLAAEVPAIIYGGKKDPQNITLTQNEFAHALENEGFYSQIITLNVDGKKEDVILKDLQRHPAKPVILHADFLRISKDQKLHTNVPLHFINEDICAGIKVGGGIAAHSMNELEISCLPADLPEYIEVDVAEVEIGQILHISDIKLPSGVESVALSHGEDHDLAIFTVNKPKAVEETSEDAGEDEAASDEEADSED
ncbi:MAG: 50S ribosomal protein L25/general stress protein Ctc [Porticoccaceae bacterium]|nr:50S ribosomal protein L25/general stress protein Ctc [Pseudomonadales bacterium]MCP5173382.1 50S ribosomal protein L25/general stress protein Ctc [Pseudomonadales bacterium]MCP5303194.1 50S ribosomal protein L25/general stress protein Ctc [Pseudomonadales bacterium]